MKFISGFIVFIFALSLIGLTIAIYWKPATAKRFLNLFASSAKSHYSEQLLRLIAGGAVILFSSHMKYSLLFEYFGWLIVATAIFLLLIPWQWHHKFGRWAIPFVIRNINLYGIVSLALGLFMLYGFFKPYLN